jgi:alpha-glucosidase
VLALACCAVYARPALAQNAGVSNSDDRRVKSPDGRVEFHIWIAPQAPGEHYRLAYEVNVDGRSLIARSYLALDIFIQDPLLGENDGLIGSRIESGRGFNALYTQYMQNGSIGRLIDIEARVYNDGVAFRYVLPHATPLDELLITDEATEFRFAAGKSVIASVRDGSSVALPFVAALPGDGYVAITEVRGPGFPAMCLARRNDATLVTRLVRKANDPEMAYEGRTPWTGPWRVILFGEDRARLLSSEWFRALK